MQYEQIISCLEQKKILITKILDLTKQIEVRCRQPEIVLDDFLDQRRSYLNRLDKCNRLISSLIENLPEDRQDQARGLLKNEKDRRPESEEEQAIAALAEECQSLIQKTMAIDRNAREALTKQYNELKEKLNLTRKKTDSIFYR